MYSQGRTVGGQGGQMAVHPHGAHANTSYLDQSEPSKSRFKKKELLTVIHVEL